MKTRYSVLMAALGVVFIATLQGLWLYNTYRLLENNLQKEFTEVVEEALLMERDLRLDRFYADTTSVSLSFDERANEITRFNEALTDGGFPVSLAAVDSLARTLLEAEGIRNDISIERVQAGSGGVLESSNPSFAPHVGGVVASDAVAVNYDKTEGVRMLVEHPYSIIFSRMLLLMLTSCLLLALVVWSLLVQMRMIRLQDRIAGLRQDFTYAMVHDMKTPLSSIIMSLRNLRGGKLDGKEELKQKYMAIAENEASQLLTLTNKILTISRLENQKLELHIDKVELEPLVKEVIQKFSVDAGKKVSFQVRLKVPQVQADPQYLAEVLSNLVDNSVKYSRDVVNVEITSQETFGHVIVSVRDDGMGISPKDLQIIFEKFERGAATFRSRQGGASGFGLGLNLVNRVLQAHGGKVEVDSVEGEYSRFSLWFPKIHTEEVS